MTCKDLISCRAAIVGLGLMGGSLALGLQGRCARLLGVDPDPKVLQLAEKMEIFDQLAADPAGALDQADLILLAPPVGVILNLLQSLPLLHSGEAAVIDLGSTKKEIVCRMAALPERFDPLGGHPMCGKEVGGLINADATIFRGAAFIFTPLPRSSESVLSLARQIAESLQTSPLWLDPETHDEWAAAVSHVPFLISNALAAATPTETGPIIGSGFRSVARLAPSPWPVMRDILETNRSQIQAGLRRFSNRILELEKALEAGGLDDLEGLLAEGARNYDLLTRSNPNSVASLLRDHLSSSKPQEKPADD